MGRRLLIALLFCVNSSFFIEVSATGWYDSAQVRIDSLRKGNFTFRIVDMDGNGVQDSIRIIHRKHEFPWGTAVDLSYSIGGAYSTTSAVIAPADSEIYISERYSTNMGYILPAEPGKKYKLTIKMAEIFFSAANSRLFDLYINGLKVMSNVDKFKLAGGKNIAVDTTFDVQATDQYIHLKIQAIKDNASIMGLVLSDSTGTALLRVNCGGSSMFTHSGNYYTNDYPYADQTVKAPGTSNDDWLKAVMLKYCNYGVCGNEFKWSGIESNHGNLTYAPFENTLRWFNDVGWDMRAHCLLWGGTSSTDYHELPQWVGALPPQNMYDTCKMRVTREVTRYKGKVHEYDVLNEPSHATYLQSKVGDSINWNCFKWAYAADSNARLFVNDYNIIEWQDQTNNFVALVKKMLDNGAPVTGIGAQCHIGATTDIVNFKKRFDQLGQFGLPIKVTEFDMGAKAVTDQQYATEISKMMRLAFSHPAIEGFVFWGITEPTWVPESIVNIIREDKTPRIAADSVYHLIHEVWTTKITDTSATTGYYSFKGYYGDYDILVKVGGTWKKYNASYKKINKDSVFIFREGEGMATNPVLKKVKFYAPTSIELTFNKPMSDPSNEYNSFKVFDNSSNYIQSASLKTGDSTTLVLTTHMAFKDKRYIPVSYFPGNITSTDGGKLEAFGPIQDAALTPAYISSKTSISGKQILVAFNGKIENNSVVPGNFIVKVGSTTTKVSEASIGVTRDTVYLTLVNPITSSGSVVTLTYTPGGLMTTDSLYVSAFDVKPVTNLILETKYVSAITSNIGTTIQVTFNQNMSDPAGTGPNFTVSANGVKVPVTNVTLLGSNNKVVILTLSSTVLKGETINLSYAPGTLSSYFGGPVTPFSIVVTNRSTVTSIGKATSKEVVFFPNPMNNHLNIANTEGFNDICITDLSGRILLSAKVNPDGITEVMTDQLKSGVYFVILTGNRQKFFSKVVKQ